VSPTLRPTRSCPHCRLAVQLFLVVFCVVAAAGCGSFAARGMNAEGVRLFQQAQYREALQQFQQAVYEDPTNADGYYNLAATYHRIGKLENRRTDLDQAENLYNQCLDRAPGHRDCYRGLAVLLVEQNRSEEAFRLVEGWVNRQPGLAEAKEPQPAKPTSSSRPVDQKIPAGQLLTMTAMHRDFG